MRVYLFGSVASLLVSLAWSASDTCTLSCNENATCVLETAKYDDHPLDINGIPFDFHKDIDKDGWSCDCPENMTGLRCNRPYERCDDHNHICYNGGKCLDGMSDRVQASLFFCDCTHAEHNGVPYVGKYCEVEGATPCAADSDVFCSNGGTCVDGFEDKAHPCECQTGHRGPHCEFDTGFVPDCTLDCENGGTCMLGIKSYEIAEHSEFWARHDGNFQYCACPEGYYGPKCEIQGTECGAIHCFNGAPCLTTLGTDGKESDVCDCSEAHDFESSFGGEFCEHEATQFCSKNEGENGHLFCTNGGTCKENIHEGCDCPDGFHGPLCELRDEQEKPSCQLQCQNNGVCRKGKKDNALINNFGDELKHYNETHRLWEHCVCPAGFFGIQCEHKLEICPGGEHVCLHGSKCVEVGETIDEDGRQHNCDCDETHNAAIEQYAGKFCQYTSTAVCTKNGQPGAGKAKFAFCVNNGSCRGIVNDNESHPGCDCKDGFTGDHCELIAGSDNLDADDGTGDDGAGGDPKDKSVEDEDKTSRAVIGLSVTLIVLVLLVCCAVERRIKDRRKSDTAGVTKSPPIPEPEPMSPGQNQATSVAEETVDMQSHHSTELAPKDLKTVEII